MALPNPPSGTQNLTDHLENPTEINAFMYATKCVTPCVHAKHQQRRVPGMHRASSSRPQEVPPAALLLLLAALLLLQKYHPVVQVALLCRPTRLQVRPIQRRAVNSAGSIIRQLPAGDSSASQLPVTTSSKGNGRRRSLQLCWVTCRYGGVTTRGQCK